MRIAFLGNFRVDYCSEVHHTKSLESLGYEVIRLQEQEATGEFILSQAMKSDLFVWVHTHDWNTPGLSMKEIIAKLKEAGIITISYHLDLYMGINRWNEYKDSEIFDLDYFFTVDKKMADYMNENTKVKGVFIPAGVFHKECYIDASKGKDKDIIFVGSKRYHPEWQWRPQLIDWLKETYGDKFEHYGNDGMGIVKGDALNKLYARTKIVIGDTLCLNFEYPYYFSDRLFETTGRGGFIIFPYIKGIEDYFDLGKELVTYKFGDFEDLKKKIDYYLEHEKEREEIRLAGHIRTKRDHTYFRRWQEILRRIEDDKS